MKTKFRFQFSIAALLAIVTLSALPAHWFGLRRRQAEVKDALETTVHEYCAEKKTAEDVYRASVNCLRVELRVPFGDHRAAYSQHLERMRWMEGRARICCGNTSGGPDALKELQQWLQKRGDEMLPWVEEAERWLDEAS